MCSRYPVHLLSYAPQLALPGAAGSLQAVVDRVYRDALERFANPEWHEARRAIAQRHRYLVLRDVNLVIVDRAAAGRQWVKSGLRGAPAQVYDVIDYAGWLVSEASVWMGRRMRDELLKGIGEWGAWLDWYIFDKFRHLQQKKMKTEVGREGLNRFYEDIVSQLDDALIDDALIERLTRTASNLRLPEDGAMLASQLVSHMPVNWREWLMRKAKTAHPLEP